MRDERLENEGERWKARDGRSKKGRGKAEDRRWQTVGGRRSWKSKIDQVYESQIIRISSVYFLGPKIYQLLVKQNIIDV